MKTSLKIALTTTALLSTSLTLMNVNPAQAGTIIGSITQTYTTGVNYDVLDWSNDFSINKFDTLRGSRVLESVDFSLNGQLRGSIKVENRSSSARTITADLEATIALYDPSNASNTLVSVIPLRRESFNLARYDGTVNYLPPSGASRDNLTAQQTRTSTFTSADGASFTQFIRGIGSNTITLTLGAIADSSVNAGNVTSEIDTDARADLTVTYYYSQGAAVPEPATIGGVVLGMGFLGYSRRRALANGKKVRK